MTEAPRPAPLTDADESTTTTILRRVCVGDPTASKHEGNAVSEIETKNAIITAATITNDDHGLLSAWVYLDYGGGGQGFGGYALYVPKAFTHGGLTQPNFAGHFLWRVLAVAGVSEWGKLVGKTVRARGTWSRVEAIGHIVKDDWFDPAVDFALMKRPPADIPNAEALP